MKKLLILAYDFPPYVSVGGLRPYSWFKYLKEFGIEPIVITRQWDNQFGNHLDYIAPGSSDQVIVEKSEAGTIIRSPYKPNLANRIMLKYGDRRYQLLRKSITGWYEIVQFFSAAGPKSGIYKEADRFLKDNKVDAIIASGDPFVLFRYASVLSQKYGIPWIADYRDPWSHNLGYQKNLLHKMMHRNLEKKIVGTASHITTVSDFVHSKIDSLTPGKPYHILINGYDPEVIESVSYIEQQNSELRIACVGTIYSWHPLESFLRVVSEFIGEYPDSPLKLRFYGVSNTERIKELTENSFPNLYDRVTISPKLSNQELLGALRRDNIMLLFNYYSFMGTKIFDYLGIQRKIILCYENDPEAMELKRKFYPIKETANNNKQLQAELIRATNAGVIVRDAVHLRSVLKELEIEFEQTGKISCEAKDVENYSRKIQVARLAEIVKTMSEQGLHIPYGDDLRSENT